MWQNWFKYGGAVVVSACLAVFGAYLSARLAKRKRLRSQLFDLLLAVKSGITHGARPLCDIYDAFPLGTLEQTPFAAVLRSGRPHALYDALETVGDELDKTVYALYREFSSKLGKSMHPDEEKALCQRYEDILSRAESALAKDESTRQALYLRMGVIAGLAFALILL